MNEDTLRLIQAYLGILVGVILILTHFHPDANVLNGIFGTQEYINIQVGFP